MALRVGGLDDHLSLENNDKVMKMIAKGGAGVPEKVLFSDYIVKINMLNKPQERVLMISDKAIYNLSQSYSSIKRRIPFDQVQSVTSSESSDEFLVHVPTEYDYRYRSLKKDDVLRCMAKAYKEVVRKDLIIHTSRNPELTALCVTKIMGKKTADKIKEERLKVMETAGAKKAGSPSDKSKDKSARGRGMTSWSNETEKAKATLEDFDLLKVIGRGSFGKVMMVRKKDGENKDKIFAMKILKKEAIIARNQVEHTKAERKILEEIDHPFLMKLHYAFQSPTKLYLVMDYLTGGEMFFHLKNDRRFPEERAKIYAAEIVMGLDHLHSQNIIYRDLKPENIILEASGHIRLTDFGLSKEFKSGDVALTFCGTPEYLAPEVIKGFGHGKEVDWWSLGILIYEMLCGLPPFYSESPSDMYQMIQYSELQFPTSKFPTGRMSWEAKTLIQQLLQRNPAERIGHGPDGGKNIREHPFFASIDWDKLYKKEIKAPFIPAVASESDISNIDAEFTDEPVVDSYADASGMSGKDDFNNFTYVPKSNLGGGGGAKTGGHGGAKHIVGIEEEEDL